MCKKLMYAILHCKKLDWLVREKDWKLDRIDFYSFLVFIIPFVLVIIFGKIFLKVFSISILLGGVFGFIRKVKNSPGDIELKLMRWSFCLQIIMIPLISLNFFLA